MLHLIDQIPLNVLIVIAIFMLIAPIYPLPHVIEKLIMLKNGDLKRPIDIFDLFFHAAPTLLLLIKLVRTFLSRTS